MRTRPIELVGHAMALTRPHLLNRDDLRRDTSAYTACYCEENVYGLLRRLTIADRGRACAVVISNAAKTVAVWRQRNGDPVVWDYHVVAAFLDAGTAAVFDFDSTLPWPCPLAAYAAAAFGSGDGEAAPAFRPRFRVVPAGDFVDDFSSDRRHMQGEGGGWLAPPPPTAPPRGPRAHSVHELPRFWAMPALGRDGDRPWLGDVVELRGLRAAVEAAVHDSMRAAAPCAADATACAEGATR